MAARASYDLLIVGGGINGVGIARDAAGRGLSVLLVEQDDLAAHTSSASTKLIHGGLRYLETYDFRLVRESLIEREKLLRIAPHISRPLTFVLPIAPHSRPAWLINLGLLLYDRLGGRGKLPKSRPVALDPDEFGAALRPDLKHGFAYTDGWVDDARLVVLNALDARERGAIIRTRTRFVGAERAGTVWTAKIAGPGGDIATVLARTIVNAAGPWVDAVLCTLDGMPRHRPPRLVKGSHIIVPRTHPRDHAYILQNADKRVLFAIPYERDFTLIGTTDVDWKGDPAAPHIEAGEIDYLCTAISRWLAKPITPSNVLHSYSGIRALYDDGTTKAAKVTRDYVLALDRREGVASLSIFGGKLTTYRRLAEHALGKLKPFLPRFGPSWTADAPLPGGDFKDFALFMDDIQTRWPFLAPDVAERMAHGYGRRMTAIIGDAQSMDTLGTNYGYGLTDAEIDYLRAEEWAMTAEDVLWRRTKLGLHLPPEAAGAIARRMLESAHG
jgi:glycerol-3-phosphate dehydrogenase